MTDETASPRDGLRSRVAGWIESSSVQRWIVALILVNAVILGLETFPDVMREYGPALLRADQIILGIFVCELVLKLFAHGARFFRSAWNLFDLVVVGIALLPASGPLAVLRALRVLRVLRLVSAIPKMRFIIESLVRSLPGIGSIFLLLIVFFYVFAVMATKLFGDAFPQWFGTLFGSMFSLFQIMTLEGWAEIARAVMEPYPLAWVYFLVFILVGTFTVLNLFIAVIVNATQEEPSPVALELAALRAELGALRGELRGVRSETGPPDAPIGLAMAAGAPRASDPTSGDASRGAASTGRTSP
jgi:voltage-gated sodium channel